MKIQNLKEIKQIDYHRIVKRSFGIDTGAMDTAKNIMDDVEKRGDSALMDLYTRWYGKTFPIQVSNEEVNNAYRKVDASVIQSLNQMKKNITAVHNAQLKSRKDTIVDSEPGIQVWREWRAIEKVGIYVPGGKAVYPSSVLMTVIPARIAGCSDIILCSPPKKDGEIPAATLVAADMAGVKKIFRLGGAEAIAAMTYGTETVPAVYKIFGAGNAYVTAAKTRAFGTVDIDMPAGPSEVFVLADETANPAYIAADLLADGEHGEDSALVLVTTSASIAEKTLQEIERQLTHLPTADRVREALKRYGLIAIADTMDDAVAFTNDYAPEHLEIMTKNYDELVAKIKNAGSIFLGDWTTKSSGDYANGANHVLPTGGMAKMFAPLGVDQYGKWMQVQKCTREGLSMVRQTIETIAEVEELPAHKQATSIRFEN